MLCLHSDLFESLTYCSSLSVFFHALYLSFDASNMILVKSLSESINNFNLQCVSKKYPRHFSCNSRKHYLIFIIFGTPVTEKVSNH